MSLGFFEREDLKAVINHLRESGGVSTIALWGRSMGAATSLMHGDRDPSIAAMVLDSPFADLTQLAEEMVRGHLLYLSLSLRTDSAQSGHFQYHSTPTHRCARASTAACACGRWIRGESRG